ncbi:MAG: hypothetical protein M3065_06535 [Actinomycetota bacterium]|nr:hypothetical protein [Actinomycetota bacterium]
MTQPSSRAPRYRVVVYQLDNDRNTKIMDATASGFIAAAASIRHSELDIALSDGGAHELKAHIALFISGQYGN